MLLPGVTRETMLAADPADVEAMRWFVFAGAMRPLVEANWDDVLQDLSDAETSPSKATLAVRRGQRREQVAQAQIAQADMRRYLDLDGED